MSDIQMYGDAVKVIKEAILRSQYRAASCVNKEQLLYIMELEDTFRKIPVLVFGVKVL